MVARRRIAGGALVVGLALAPNARADERLDVAPSPIRSRVGVEGEGTTATADGVRYSYQTVAAIAEGAPSSALSFRIRVPVHHLSRSGAPAATGLGDIDLRFRWRVRRGDPFQASLGATLGLPTGDAARSIGDGKPKLAPFVTAGWAVGASVVYVTIADQLSLTATDGNDATDPGTNHEVHYDLGVIERFGEVLFAIVTGSGVTVLTPHGRGDTLGFATLQLGATPDPAVRLTVGLSLPVFGEHRFDARTLAAATLTF